MRAEYDRMACEGWFQCVQKWEVFKINLPEGKADLAESEDHGNGVFTREIPAEAEELAKEAAVSCPAGAIIIYDDTGKQLVP